MGLFVNTNVASINASNNLAKSTKSLDTSLQRLASGLRINSAKDDAAGLQISDRLTTQINGLNQGNRNAQDGISFCNTVEGAMDEMTSMYQRIRTLAIQSANGTNSDEDRRAIQEEVTQLSKEINRIANDTTFGGEPILTGEEKTKINNDSSTLTSMVTVQSSTTSCNKDFQVGADANQTISVNIGNKNGKINPKSLISIGNKTNITTASRALDPGATESIRITNENYICTSRLKGTLTYEDGTTENFNAYLEATQGVVFIHSYCVNSSMYYGKKNNVVQILSTYEGFPDIGDKKCKIYYTTALTMNEATYGPQVNGYDDTLPSLGWSISDVAYNLLIGGECSDYSINSIGQSPLSTYTDENNQKALQFDVSTAENAQLTIDCIDKFIAKVDSKRAELGAVQNRLESTIRNQSNITNQLSDARSNIRDCDFSSETAQMTVNTIKQQASQSILSQANALPNIALSLLKN